MLQRKDNDMLKNIVMGFALSSIAIMNVEASKMEINPQIPNSLIENFKKLSPNNSTKKNLSERIKEMGDINITQERISNLWKVVNEVLEIAQAVGYEDADVIKNWLNMLHLHVLMFEKKEDADRLKFVWGDQYRLGMPWWDFNVEAYSPIKEFLIEKQKTCFFLLLEKLKKVNYDHSIELPAQPLLEILKKIHFVFTEEDYFDFLNINPVVLRANGYNLVNQEVERFQYSILRNYVVLPPENSEKFLNTIAGKRKENTEFIQLSLQKKLATAKND